MPAALVLFSSTLLGLKYAFVPDITLAPIFPIYALALNGNPAPYIPPVMIGIVFIALSALSRYSSQSSRCSYVASALATAHFLAANAAVDCATSIAVSSAEASAYSLNPSFNPRFIYSRQLLGIAAFFRKNPANLET